MSRIHICYLFLMGGRNSLNTSGSVECPQRREGGYKGAVPSGLQDLPTSQLLLHLCAFLSHSSSASPSLPLSLHQPPPASPLPLLPMAVCLSVSPSFPLSLLSFLFSPGVFLSLTLSLFIIPPFPPLSFFPSML